VYLSFNLSNGVAKDMLLSNHFLQHIPKGLLITKLNQSSIFSNFRSIVSDFKNNYEEHPIQQPEQKPESSTATTNTQNDIIDLVSQDENEADNFQKEEN